jgi:hypothetical protein
MDQNARQAVIALRDLINRGLEDGSMFEVAPLPSPASPTGVSTGTSDLDYRKVAIGEVKFEAPADGSPTYYAKPNGGQAHLVVAVDFDNKKFTTLEYVDSNGKKKKIKEKEFLRCWNHLLEGKAVRRTDPPITGDQQPKVAFD